MKHAGTCVNSCRPINRSQLIAVKLSNCSFVKWVDHKAVQRTCRTFRGASNCNRQLVRIVRNGLGLAAPGPGWSSMLQICNFFELVCIRENASSWIGSLVIPLITSQGFQNGILIRGATARYWQIHVYVIAPWCLKANFIEEWNAVSH